MTKVLEWIDGEAVLRDALPEELPEAALDPVELERAGMTCSPLQGMLALGQTEWARVEFFLSDPGTPWAMRQAISRAGQWQRNSATIDELAWLMGYDAPQVDDLFRLAMTIKV